MSVIGGRLLEQVMMSVAYTPTVATNAPDADTDRFLRASVEYTDQNGAEQVRICSFGRTCTGG